MRSLAFPVTALALLAAAAACNRVDENASPPVTPQTAAAVDDAAAVAPAPTASAPSPGAEPERPRLVASALILEQWGKAENRANCAPLAFAGTAGARGSPRPAEFAGGWAVAFDLPNLRSAYGLAGAGIVPDDAMEPDSQRARLQQQWPYFRDIAQLPQPAFAGYGVEGATAYPAGNGSGRGLNSLAYLRAGGQACTYNVWSRLGRAHLEALLGQLRMVPLD